MQFWKKLKKKVNKRTTNFCYKLFVETNLVLYEAEKDALDENCTYVIRGINYKYNYGNIFIYAFTYYVLLLHYMLGSCE